MGFKNNDRILVTGFDMETSLGDTWETFNQLLNNASGVTFLNELWTQALQIPVNYGGRIKNDITQSESLKNKTFYSHLELVTKLLSQRVKNTMNLDKVDGENILVSAGTGLGAREEYVYANILLERGKPIKPHGFLSALPSAPATVAAQVFNAKAGALTSISGCASSNDAILKAVRALQLGDCQLAVVIGVENRIEAIPVAAFNMIKAVAKKPNENNDFNPGLLAKPFDKDRTGFVFGEAAGIMVLETEKHAIGRGVEPLAVVSGAGLSSDGYHIVAPEPNGLGASHAMVNALRNAQLDASEVTVVNAHATGTPLGDDSEAKAIQRAFGDNKPVYAVKGALGHSIGAAGIIEAIISVQTILKNKIPPTVNCVNLDPKLDYINVIQKPVDTTVEHVVNNSFAFGGSNVTTIFSKYR